MQADGTLVCFGLNLDGQCDVPADLGPILAVRPTGLVGHQFSTGIDTESEHEAVMEESIPHVDDAAGSRQAMESVVIDSIVHAEPPAMIDEQEASQIADVQHAGFIERTIGAMTDEATCYIDDDVKDVRINLSLHYRVIKLGSPQSYQGDADNPKAAGALSDDAGKALRTALKESVSLQSFQLSCGSTSMDCRFCQLWSMAIAIHEGGGACD